MNVYEGGEKREIKKSNEIKLFQIKLQRERERKRLIKKRDI